tara:strand:+ start:1306 stop:2082 length:777 start_codon:yes stop_codon:yes gene_type:complete
VNFLEAMFSLKGKTAIVTGASGGLGRHISTSLIESGAQVVLADIDKSGLSSLIDELESKNLKASKYVLDLTEKTEIVKFVAHIKEKYGKIDILINNAGVTYPHSFFEYPEKAWDMTYKINLWAPYELSRKVAEVMKENNSGSIINITSLNAELAFPNNPAYVTFKGALKQLSKSMALELGKYNIRVNNVGPGYMKTEMTKKSWSDPVIHEERKNKTVLNRWGTPEDLAGPIVFLASDASGYVTGQDIYVDGGWLIKGL